MADWDVVSTSPYDYKSQNRQGVVDFWKSKGAPEHVAEGIADRVKVESGFDPTVKGDGGTSVGLYQHHDERMTKLRALPDWQNPDAQNKFAFSEVTGGDPIATAGWERIKNAKTREEANKLWTQYFERPAATHDWTVTGSDKWRVSDRALAYEQSRGDSNVVYMSPADYLAMTPEIDGDGASRTKRQSLRKSLEAGDELGVGDSVQAGRGVDARDPELAEITFAILAAHVREVQRLLHGLLGDAMAARLHPEEATGSLQDLGAAILSFGTPFDSRHDSPRFPSLRAGGSGVGEVPRLAQG